MLTLTNKISACPGPLQHPPGASQESGGLLRPVKEEEEVHGTVDNGGTKPWGQCRVQGGWEGAIIIPG